MDMSALMQQAQQLQGRMQQMQEELAQKQVTSTVGGGMVSVTVNGRHQLLDITIDREVVNPDDVAMLQDLVAAAVNEAMAKAQEMMQQEMRKVTGGLNIPGLF